MDVSNKELYTKKRPSGCDLTADNIAPAIENVKHDNSIMNWLWLSLVDNNKIELKDTNSNGFDGLVSPEQLDDSLVLFGFIRVIVLRQIKFYGIFFVGDDVPGMKKVNTQCSI